MISSPSIRTGSGKAAASLFALVVALTITACHDATGPHPLGPAVRILPVEDSVFEGDSVRLAAQVFDKAGNEVADAPVAWTVSDTTLARVVADSVLALLRPGTVRITARSGTAADTYDLPIGRLVVKRVELTPETVDMGRTDHLTVTARVLGQGDREITDRAITFTSDDTLVAIVYGPPATGSAAGGLLIAVGAGSTTIHANVDGVKGTAHVGVVLMDTTFTLTQYNDSPVPVLEFADTIVVDGIQKVYEVYDGPGTLVLSGLLQRRYQLDVLYSVYEVTPTADSEERELRFQVPAQRDRGLVTVTADGSLSMVSEIIGPLLEHTATLRPDGYLVHYRIPGENLFLDLRFARVTP